MISFPKAVAAVMRAVAARDDVLSVRFSAFEPELGAKTAMAVEIEHVIGRFMMAFGSDNDANWGDIGAKLDELIRKAYRDAGR